MKISKCELLSFLLTSTRVAIVFATLQENANEQSDSAASNGASAAASWPPIDESWNYWWSYSAISGPSYWGVMNPSWFICDKGKRQSPIDIRTQNLIFDPSLTPLKVDNNLIWVSFYNDGHAILLNRTNPTNKNHNSDSENNNQISETANKSNNNKSSSSQQLKSLPSATPSEKIDLKFKNLAIDRIERFNPKQDLTENLLSFNTDNLQASSMTDASRTSDMLRLARSTEFMHELADDKDQGGDSIGTQMSEGTNDDLELKFSGAGLAYSYQFERLYIRFGTDAKAGSEHHLDSKQFAAELQLLAYNSQLYPNFYEASMKPLGLMAISVLVELLGPTEMPNKVGLLDDVNFVSHLEQVKFRGSSSQAFKLNVTQFILPQTNQFVSYEGSLTIPGCYETVNWIVMNKPMYITNSQLDLLKSISADEDHSSSPAGSSSGKVIAGNIRPIQAPNNRLLRTNIIPASSVRGQEVPETCKRQLLTKYQYRISR